MFSSVKLYKPLFSVLVILVQLILSIKDYYRIKEWRLENPELQKLVNLIIRYESHLLSIAIIGIFEMLIKPSIFKNLIRLLLLFLVLGYGFAIEIPINGFKYLVYNTATFSAVIASILILFRIGKHSLRLLKTTK